MRPAVLIAVLLLVDILNTGTVVHGGGSARLLPNRYLAPSCGDGWIRISKNGCIKYITSPESFCDAQEHCRSLNGDLMTFQNLWSPKFMIYLNNLIIPQLQPFWVGAKKTPLTKYYEGEDACMEVNYKVWFRWINALCSEKKPFICIKKM